MGACAQARLVHSGCMARNVVLPYPPRTSACRERPVRTTLIFNTFRENVTTVRQTSPEGYSIRCGRSAFFIISVHHRHFCCSHFYCFGANRIKIAKSVQKTSKSNIFCTDFIIFRSIVIRDSRFVNEFHILKATCKFCTRLSTFVMTFPFFPLLL